MRLRFLIIFIIFGGLAGKLSAQQIPIYSQYLFNPYLVNPAYAGVKEYYETIANYRYQWVGITDAPRTYALSVNGPHKTKNLGIGGNIIADVVGPTNRTAIYGTGAYHIPFKNSHLSLGLSLGVMQLRVDGQKIFLIDEGDPIIMNAVLSSILPDMSLGAYWYGDNYYLGASIPQFMNTTIDFYTPGTRTRSTLTRHFMAMGGYTFEVNSDLEIEPSILMRYTAPVDFQFDFSSKFIYRDRVWAGFTYRTEDAMSVMIGYKGDNDKLYFGYAYDFTFSNLRNYSSGSHELMVAAKFNDWKSRIERLERKLN